MKATTTKSEYRNTGVEYRTNSTDQCTLASEAAAATVTFATRSSAWSDAPLLLCPYPDESPGLALAEASAAAAFAAAVLAAAAWSLVRLYSSLTGWEVEVTGPALQKQDGW